jgi:hypothetical protein
MARVIVEPPVKQAAVQLIAELVADEEVGFVIFVYICACMCVHVYMGVWCDPSTVMCICIS